MAEDILFQLENTQMPFSVEAEQSVLGSVLIDPKCINTVATSLKPEHFYLPQHKEIYTVLLSMYDHSNPIDFVTLFETLKNSGAIDRCGGKQYITQLVQTVPSSANVTTYIDIVKERYYARSLLLAAQTIITDIDNGGDASELIDSAEQKIFEIREGRISNELVHIASVIKNETYDRLQKIADPKTRDDYLGIKCGIQELDETLTGFNKSDLIILGARPGVGKTSFALNIARNIAVDAKKTVCFFSLEMTRDQLAQRLLSNEAGIGSDHLRDSSKMTEMEWVRLAQASEVLSKANIYLDETSSLTVPQMKAKVRRMEKVDMVIVDYLGLMHSSTAKENRVQEVSEISRGLKVMAKELNIPVLVCAQLNRGVEGKGGVAAHKPGLADLRDSGSIEQDADIVMFLCRETQKGMDGEEDGAKTNEVELLVAKNRHGETKTIPLNWDGKFTRFTAVDTLHEEM